jgi:hypothetical protein
MDLIALDDAQKAVWQMNDPLPVPGLRSEVCAQGVKDGTALMAEGYAAMALATHVDKADAVCAAFWPHKAGWLKFSAAGMAEQGAEYIYATGDWPAWQMALRSDATMQYAARSRPAAAGQVAAVAGVADGGSWSGVRAAGVLFGIVLLCLWWREQRQIGGAGDRL